MYLQCDVALDCKDSLRIKDHAQYKTTMSEIRYII